MMKAIDALFAKLGYVRSDSIRAELNYAHSIGKRLDEHREKVQDIEHKTELFESGIWHVTHMAIQDDFLMRLYRMVHGCWPSDEHGPQPTGEFVRPRPKILGPCHLPEYKAPDSAE